MIDSSEVIENRNLKSRKNYLDLKKKKTKRTNNKLCSTLQKAGIRLSRTASKEQFNQVLYFLPWRHSVWVVSLSLLPEQNQSCLIFAVAGT